MRLRCRSLERRTSPHPAPAVLGDDLLELEVEAVGGGERARSTYSSPSTRVRASRPTLKQLARPWSVPYDGDRRGALRVYAVKYAERDARRAEHFLGGDPHDAPMPMDYFVWAVVGDDETWVVDTGFGSLDATRRNRRLLRTAAEALATIGVDAACRDRRDPDARSTTTTRRPRSVPERSVPRPGSRDGVRDRAAHDRAAGKPWLHRATTSPSSCTAVHAGRVVFHDGDEEVAPGLSVHLLGGHTDGLQVVRVETGNGAGSCSRPTPRTTTRTSRPGGRSRSCTTSTRWSTAGRRCDGWRRRRRDRAGARSRRARARPGRGARPRRRCGQARHRPPLSAARRANCAR